MDITRTIAAMGPPWQLYLDFIVFCLGACMGSFLNVCIYRIPREESVVTPGSHCPHCATPIAWYDNLPLLSWLLLRAKCRKCGGPISARYVLVELLTAILFLMVWLKFSPAGHPCSLALSPVFDIRLVPIYWLAVFGLMLGTFVDLEHMIIPDRVSLGGIVLGIGLSALVPSMHPRATTALGGASAALLGAAVGAGSLWLVAMLGKIIFRKDAMGLGDVKLLGAIGAFLGWVPVVFTIMMSSFAGAIVGVTLVLSGRKEMQSRIPYGPYLALAALVWMFWGPTLTSLYLDWLLPPTASI